MLDLNLKFTFLPPSISEHKRDITRSEASPELPTLDTSYSSFNLKSLNVSLVELQGISEASTHEEVSLIVKQPLEPEGDLTTPGHVYYGADYQRLVDYGRVLCQTIKDKLSQAKDNELDSLTQLADKLSKSDPRSTRTIAVLGDSGAGKSSLINSLLDCPGLAKEGNAGKAVTSVATEFRYLDGKEAGYRLEIDCQTEEEIAETVRDYVWNYQNLRLTNVKDIGAEEYHQIEHKHKNAKDALRAIFGYDRDFNAILTILDEQSYDIATEKLQAYAADLKWPNNTANGRWISTMKHAKQCTAELQRFSECNMWPLIKVARVYSKATLLKHGVVLVDLPGLRDVNSARVKASEEYLARVDHVFVVTPSIRAVSSKSVDDSLFKVVQRHFPNEWITSGAASRNISVICTRSEDFNLDDIENELVEDLHLLDENVVEDLKQKEEDAICEADRRQWEMKRRHLFMRTRNAHIISAIQRDYIQKANGKSIMVFCVSSTEYKDARKYKNEQMMAASEIPALRKHCLTIVADHLFSESQVVLMHAIPELLQSIKLYTEPRHKVDTDVFNIVSIASTMLNQLEIDLELNSDCLSVALTHGQMKPLTSQKGGYVRRWTDAALDTHQIYEGWHFASYRAFLGKDGEHTTAAAGYANWNDTMSKQMQKDLYGIWKILSERISLKITKSSDTIKALLEKLASEAAALPLFQQILEHMIPSLQLEFDKIQYAALVTLRAIRTKVEEANRASFMRIAMLPAYRRAAQDCGTGVVARRIACITNHLSGSLFIEIIDSIQGSLKTLSDSVTSEVQETCRQAIKKLNTDLKAVKRQAEMTAETASRDHLALRTHLIEWIADSNKAMVVAKSVRN